MSDELYKHHEQRCENEHFKLRGNGNISQQMNQESICIHLINTGVLLSVSYCLVGAYI